MRIIARLLMASLMGIALLTITVSRSSANGTILRARASLSGAAGSGISGIEHVTSRVTVAPGPLSLFDANGSSVIVHLNQDQGTTGVPGGSGGPRIACGVIEMVQ
jgi:hypothetical protein